MFEKKRLITKFLFLSILLMSRISALGQNSSKLNVTTDVRIETLYAIALYSDYFLINKHNNVYKQELLSDKFENLKKHRAVRLFDTLSRKYDFSYYRIIDWALVHSPIPEFKVVHTLPENNSFAVAGNKTLLQEFEREFRSFAKDSLFKVYLQKNEVRHADIIAQIDASKTLRQIPSFLEDFYGGKLSSYNLILSPLIHSGGFNSEIINASGEKMIYACIGPNGEIDFKPYFEKEFIEMDLLLHEFGHSFVNPLMDKYGEKIDSLKPHYYTEAFSKAAKGQGYTEWKYAFNEAVIRAATIIIAERHFGEEKASELMNYEKSVGFLVTEKIVDIISENYQPSAYHSFATFYPVLLDKLSQ